MVKKILQYSEIPEFNSGLNYKKRSILYTMRNKLFFKVSSYMNKENK